MTDWRKYEREQREWDLEHLSDDEWARRYSPGCRGLAIGLILSAILVGMVVGIVILATR